MTVVTGPPPAPAVDGGAPSSGRRRADVVFSRTSALAGLTVLLVIVAITVFLVARALPALRENTANFLTFSRWLPDAEPSTFGIAALAFGTVLSSLLALVMAVPVALGTALFITEFAPRRLARPLGYVTDLLAAVPSVVYGLWGVLFLVPRMAGLQEWLSTHLSFVPIFENPDQIFGRSIFAASVVLAIMVLPIIAAISREVFLQVPLANREAALALGATRWEMIRTAVLPFSRPGIISAVMLGLGRALGETVAVALVLSASFEISPRVLEPGGNTIAANIATKFGEAAPTGQGALIASGLVLFVITLVVNVTARLVIARNNRRLAGL
jgi:phosphate transport system permease protein